MKRRSAIKHLGLITTGTLLLPSCVGKVKQTSVVLKNISLTGQQEATLMAMVKTIIPATAGVPGAGDMPVGEFVLRMVDDCCNKETQQTFMAGLAQAEKQVHERFDAEFDELNAAQQLQFLQELESRPEEAAENLPATPEGATGANHLAAFYNTVKRYTIQGYVNSEYVLGTVFGYTHVPGRFTGSVEVTADSDVKTIMG